MMIGGKWWASERRMEDVWRQETSGHLREEDQRTEEELKNVVYG
jgi:hypothetical protein